MKCLGVFTVSTMDIPFVFSNPELVLSSVSSSKATNTYCIGAEDISEVKKGYSQQCLGIEMDLISLGRFTISLACHIVFRVYSLISLNLKSVLKTMRSVVYRPAVYCDACCFCIKKYHYWTALLNIYCNASHQ